MAWTKPQCSAHALTMHSEQVIIEERCERRAQRMRPESEKVATASTVVESTTTPETVPAPNYELALDGLDATRPT